MHRLTSFVCRLTLAVAPLVIGCGASSTATDGVESAALQQPVGTQQSFPRMAWITQRQFVDAFLADVGPEWGQDAVVDGYMGFVRHAEANVPSEPAVSITIDEAKDKGLAFIRKIGGHLGVSEAEIAQLEFFTTTDSHQLFDRSAHFYLGYGATIARPGYEAFPEVGTHVVVWLAMEADGTVSGVDQRYTERVPRLRLGTVPSLAASDDRVTANVVGLPFVFWNVHAGVCIGPSHSLGPIGRSDIAAPSLTMVVDRGASLDIHLAYRLAVSKNAGSGGRSLEYSVDAATGQILRQPEKPCRDEQN